MPSACRLIVRAYGVKVGHESCSNAKAKYSSSVVPPNPSIHFHHCLFQKKPSAAVAQLLHIHIKYVYTQPRYTDLEISCTWDYVSQ